MTTFGAKQRLMTETEQESLRAFIEAAWKGVAPLVRYELAEFEVSEIRARALFRDPESGREWPVRAYSQTWPNQTRYGPEVTEGFNIYILGTRAESWDLPAHPDEFHVGSAKTETVLAKRFCMVPVTIDAGEAARAENERRMPPA